MLSKIEHDAPWGVAVKKSGPRTRDMGGNSSTVELGSAIAEALA